MYEGKAGGVRSGRELLASCRKSIDGSHNINSILREGSRDIRMMNNDINLYSFVPANQKFKGNSHLVNITSHI